jgi:hypothetical protein
MATRKPLVLISGVSSELPPGDLVPGVDTTAQASGNAALVVASNALASGNLGVTNSATAQASGNAALVVGTTALASGNAGISVGLTALASGNAGISTGLTALASGNAGISTGLTALASGNAALSSAATAQASGNAALSSLANKYDKTGGPISGPAFTRSQTFGVPSGTILGSGVITLNFGLSDNFEVVLTAGTSTLASPVNASGGQCGALIFRQDSVGSRLLTYSGSWSFVAATAPTLTTTASGVDMLGYYVVNPSRINIVSNLNFGSGTVS